MPRDYLDLGAAPGMESPVQVGTDNYESLARPECIRFIELIRKTLGPEPQYASLQVTSNPHDFGAYLSVVVRYDDQDEEARNYAFRCEEEAPAEWGGGVIDARSSELITSARASQVCGSCLGAAEEEGLPDRESQELVMVEMGADIADHLCDATEAPDLDLRCSCACQRR